MGEIRSINAIRADRENDNTLLSPRDLMFDVVADIDDGTVSPTKAFVIVVDDADGQYRLNWFASNAKASEIISMCEAAKIHMLKAMGFIPDA